MSVGAIKPCEECGRNYNHVALDSCPGCNATNGSGTNRFVVSPERKDHLELIRAQDRTTHALRAIVIILRFFMANLFLVGSWVIFGFSSNPAVVVIACLIWIAAAWVTLYQADKEFGMTK